MHYVVVLIIGFLIGFVLGRAMTPKTVVVRSSGGAGGSAFISGTGRAIGGDGGDGSTGGKGGKATVSGEGSAQDGSDGEGA